jgi:hypothetical protein
LDNLQKLEVKMKKKEKGILTKDRRVRIEEEDNDGEEEVDDDQEGEFYEHDYPTSKGG